MLISRRGFHKQFREKYFTTGKCYFWQTALPIITTVLSGLMNKPKKQQTADSYTVSQDPKQQAAMAALLKFAQTGQLEGGNFDYGADYGGSLGNYDMSALEQGGQSKIMEMLKGGLPSSFTQGKDEMTKLFAGDTYDPMAKGGIYEGFKKQALREGQEGADTLKRNLAVRGNLYSTNTGKEMGLLGERTQDSLQSKLASLADTYAQRKLNMVPTALNAGQTEQTMGLQMAGAAGTAGALQRQLDDQRAKDAYAEWMRSRGEKLNQISSQLNAYGGMTNAPPASVTIPATYATQANPWSALLNSLTQMDWTKMLGGNSKETPIPVNA